ncbi:hypothetical protein D4R75_14315 [bacterium]|nr:MAG: hypothetical protein D4R75_14315 [bacterium]
MNPVKVKREQVDFGFFKLDKRPQTFNHPEAIVVPLLWSSFCLDSPPFSLYIIFHPVGSTTVRIPNHNIELPP